MGQSGIYYLQVGEILCNFTNDLPLWKKSSDTQAHPTTTTRYCFHVRKRDGKVVMYVSISEVEAVASVKKSYRVIPSPRSIREGRATSAPHGVFELHIG